MVFFGFSFVLYYNRVPKYLKILKIILVQNKIVEIYLDLINKIKEKKMKDRT